MRYASQGHPIPTRHEVTIDTSTMLPATLRLFRIESAERGWECRALIVFEYPTEAQVRSVMAGEPFGGLADQR